jgi:hypothetical protein
VGREPVDEEFTSRLLALARIRQAVDSLTLLPQPASASTELDWHAQLSAMRHHVTTVAERLLNGVPARRRARTPVGR